MTDQAPPTPGPAPTPGPLDDLPEARVARPRRHRLHLSMVWLLPLVAALTGAWLVYRDYAARGPLVTIRFANAEGIAAN